MNVWLREVAKWLRYSSAMLVMILVVGGGCGGSKDKPAARRTAPVAEAPPPPPTPQTRPVARRGNLYDRMGGESVVRKVVDDFVTRAAADPAVNFTRQGQANPWQATPENLERLKQRLVEFIATAAGGPMQYQGSDIVTAHRGMGITHKEFDALAGHLRAALEASGVPRREREELLNAVASTRGAVVEAGDAPAPGESAPSESPPPEETPPDAGSTDAPSGDAPPPADATPPEPAPSEAPPEKTPPTDLAPEPAPEPADPQPLVR